MLSRHVISQPRWHSLTNRKRKDVLENAEINANENAKAKNKTAIWVEFDLGSVIVLDGMMGNFE